MEVRIADKGRAGNKTDHFLKEYVESLFWELVFKFLS